MENHHQLTYEGRANKNEHGNTGYRYFHNFVTGYGNLIFDSHESAARFAKRNDCKLTAPKRLCTEG